jgi:hypothetical protein
VRAIVILALACGIAHADRVDEESLTRPPPIMPTPLPPAPEIAQLAKQLAGTWTCGHDKVTITVMLDGAWLVLRGPREHEWRTYDGVAKLWTRIVVSAGGTHAIATSLGEQDGAWTWTERADARSVERWTKNRVVRSTEQQRAGQWQRVGAELTCSK